VTVSFQVHGTPAPQGSTVLTFGWPRPPLNANQRLHWAQKAKLTRTIREITKMTAQRDNLQAADQITVQLTWVVADKRRRDSDNVYPTFKAMCDGLVDAGIVPDDTPQYMDKRAPLIRHEPGGRPRLELEVTA
jgi:crossover junction endodeoxyribonuclease RusA